MTAQTAPARAGGTCCARSSLFCGAYWPLPAGARPGRRARRRTRSRTRATSSAPSSRSGCSSSPPCTRGRRRRAGSPTARAGCTSTRTSRSPRSRSRSSTCAATSTSTSCATCSWSRWGSRSSATWSFPTAPPRLMPEWGFRTRSRDFTGVDAQSSGTLFNPFAAVPSMHVAFALMLGISMAGIARHRAVRVLWCCYPRGRDVRRRRHRQPLVVRRVLGAATAAVSALAAQALLARARPDAWAWDPAARPARA